MDMVIEARNLVKRLAGKTVVDGLQFEVKKGEVFGFYGPIGSGKTSLLRMIYCSSPVTSGDLYVLGLNASESPSKVKSRIGVVPQEEGLDLDFSVLDNLLVYASYHGIPPQVSKPKARTLLRRLRLDDCDDHPVESLSPGARRRLMVARCLMNDPEILFLDEPTSGLPPEEKQQVWKLFKEMQDKGKSLVLSTCDPAEASRVCDRIILLNHGQEVISGVPKDIINQKVGKEIIEFRIQQAEIDYYTKKVRDEFEYQIVHDRLRLYLKNKNDHRRALELVDGHHLHIRSTHLEDVFLKLTGSEFWSKDRRQQ